MMKRRLLNFIAYGGLASDLSEADNSPADKGAQLHGLQLP